MIEKLLKRFGYNRISPYSIGHPCPQNKFKPPNPGGKLWITPQGRTVFLTDNGVLQSFATFRKQRQEMI